MSRDFFLGARFVERGLAWALALEREIEKKYIYFGKSSDQHARAPEGF